MEGTWLFLTAYSNSKKFKLKWHQKAILLTEKHTAGPQNHDALGDPAPLLEYSPVCVRPGSVCCCFRCSSSDDIRGPGCFSVEPWASMCLETQYQLGKQTKTHQKYNFKIFDFRFRSYSFL